MKLRCLFVAGLAILPAGMTDASDGVPTKLILCMGDSITYGVTQSAQEGRPWQLDSLGGYPARLQRRLGSRARVLNRGIAGATAEHWLAGEVLRNPKLWPRLPDVWPDFRFPGPPEGASSLAQAVVQVERPDVAVIFLGVNDLTLPTRASKDKVPEEVARRLTELHSQVKSVVPIVLVATSLPNHRDPVELQHKLNAEIRAAFSNYLPLGERFAAAGWEDLLGDAIHPNERGYAVLAEILADELVHRQLVTAVPEPTGAETRHVECRRGAARGGWRWDGA